MDRRVDPVQAYPLAVHLNGIAVDHRGDPDHIGKGRTCEQAQGEDQGAHGHRMPWLPERISPSVVNPSIIPNCPNRTCQITRWITLGWERLT